MGARPGGFTDVNHRSGATRANHAGLQSTATGLAKRAHHIGSAQDRVRKLRARIPARGQVQGSACLRVVYNKVQTDRDSYKVRARRKPIASSIEHSLREAQDSDPASQLDSANRKLDESLARVEELLNPIILNSPIDGKIGSISKQSARAWAMGKPSPPSVRPR